jgi:acetyl/propionyl-CoA carboxylase alpha subunit
VDSATLANKLAAYDQNKVTSTDALNEALKQYGVPEIRNTVSGLRTTLANTQNAYNAVDPSVTGRTQGSLVTEAQRTKQVSNERAPIAGQISDQSKALTQNQQDLQDALGQATTQATNKVNDYTAGRAALQSEYDTARQAEQDRAAATLAAQQEAEKQREFNVTSSQKQATTPSPADVKLQVGQHVAQQLASNTGKDGYVSNETWAAALNDAVASGFTTREFFQKYSQFVNPKYKTSYAGWANR